MTLELSPLPLKKLIGSGRFGKVAEIIGGKAIAPSLPHGGAYACTVVMVGGSGAITRPSEGCRSGGNHWTQ